MNNLYVNAKQIKMIFFSEQVSMSATYELMAIYKKRFRKQGLINLNARKLPRDWFLNEIQKDNGYSDKEIELIRTKLEELDNSPKGEEKWASLK